MLSPGTDVGRRAGGGRSPRSEWLGCLSENAAPVR